VNFLFEGINFKNVWDATDNTRRCETGYLKWKISWPSAAALGFQSFVLYRLMMVRGKNVWIVLYRFTAFPQLPFCPDFLCFPSYLSVQIYCVSPATFLYRFSALSHLPLCTDLPCFSTYLSVHIYCASPATFLCSIIPHSVFPTYSYLYKHSYSV